MPETDYELSGQGPAAAAPAPRLDYRPPTPKTYRPRIGLIGCGGITESHLKAYAKQGWEVAAFCDISEEAAGKRRDAFNPDGEVYTDRAELLKRDDIDVIDAALHPAARAAVIEDALNAGKHVLSQKPFAIDLDTAKRLVDLADQRGVKLAVNQNGRWAPHVAYARAAVERGVLGELSSIDLSVHWDHNWIVGTAFDNIPQVILFDFAVHWFDMVRCYTGDRRIKRATAAVVPLSGQKARPPLGAHVLLQADGLLATLCFNANASVGGVDRTLLVGSKGMLESTGPSLGDQTVTLQLEDGKSMPELEGQWFSEGFAGTMGELLCAIEEDREPSNSAANNLHSLEITFATMASAERGGQPVEVGSAPRIEPSWLTYD
ncbi:MAG: Gfo/Idh/MocA family oxidoreductase [Planctomycetota bacterium]